MRLVAPISLFCVILEVVVLHCQADENSNPEKRYIAALAKNGRLPKFGGTQKKNDESKEILPAEPVVYPMTDEIEVEYPSDSLSEDKRSVGAFFKARGRPNFSSAMNRDRSGPEEEAGSTEVKRNVATLARLGRLNAIRYGRFQNRLVGKKRLNSEESSNPKVSNDEDNGIDVLGDLDCHDSEVGANDVEDSPNWTEKKRYVAALARSGRLPIWHSQRMWGAGKRDDSLSYENDSRYYDNNEDFDNTIDETARASQKHKRCKKGNGYQTQKRNVAALAKNGKLPFVRPQEEKRNIAALAKNGKLPNRGDKRNIQAMARNGKLPFNNYEGSKRNIAALARNGKLPHNNYEENKRNVAALARNGKLPFNNYENNKRNVAALARNGKLPSFDQQGKRNIAALARNGKLPSYIQDGKRNEAVFDQNGVLPFNSYEFQKRNIQALARNGKLPFSNSQDEKRNIAALARNGKLLFNTYPNEKRSEEDLESSKNALIDIYTEKRNVAALARNGKLPFTNYRNEKKNIAALARNGKLPFITYQDNKRSDEDYDNSSLDNFQKEKRNLSALARNGKLPEHAYREGKRNIAALARNGKLPAYNGDGKRNLASLARNGKLPVSV